MYDFGARNYDPALGRWMNVDPLADHPKQIGISPYAYCANNPVIYVDPTGMLFDDYGMDDEGNITLLRETDDNFDRLYNSEDVFVGEVNKGFLSDGINIEKDGLFLDVQNKEDFLSYLSFVTDLSVDVNKEIGGFILVSESGFDDIYITSYEESTSTRAISLENFIVSDSYNIGKKELSLGGNKHKASSWFHTHPDIMSPGHGSSKPSDGDINVTKRLQIPGLVLGGWRGMGLINTDGNYIRWGN